MTEFRRVLKENGWAILLVPITADKTFEDPFIIDPDERLRAFGQRDHVRRYGPDYIDRQVTDLVDKKAATLMGLSEASGEIYYCTK